MKTKQVMHFCEFGKEYSVIKILDSKENNPYRIYHHYRDIGADGQIHEHRKQMDKYADLYSCFFWFMQNNVI